MGRPKGHILALLGLLHLFAPAVVSKDISIEQFGAKAGLNASPEANTAAISTALNSAQSGDRVYVPGGKVYQVVGCIQGVNLTDVVFSVDGGLRAVANYSTWANETGDSGTEYFPLIQFSNCNNITLTAAPATTATDGVIEGNGIPWWNRWIFGDHKGLKRPKLVIITASRNIQGISADMTTPLEPEDLNTDGIDFSGRDIWVHDCDVQNDDDSIAVKPCDSLNCQVADTHCTQDALIENTRLTGFGASIGSVPPHPNVNCVRNITFRNISMPKTGKGVYIKSNPECAGNSTAIIADITYEDMDIVEPEWWPIWIGPQQQQEPGSSLGLKCSLTFPFPDKCPTQGCVDFRNITLRRINITRPWLSPGVILGNSTNPMRGILFDHVVVTDPGTFPYNRSYYCPGAAEVTVLDSTPSLPKACLEH